MELRQHKKHCRTSRNYFNGQEIKKKEINNMQYIKVYFKGSQDALLIDDVNDMYDEERLEWFKNHGSQYEFLNGYNINKAAIDRIVLEKVIENEET